MGFHRFPSSHMTWASFFVTHLSTYNPSYNATLQRFCSSGQDLTLSSCLFRTTYLEADFATSLSLKLPAKTEALI